MRKLFLVALILSGACATTDPTSNPVNDCLQTGPCTVVQVDNQAAEVKLYINGSYFSSIAPVTKTTLFVPNWRLPADKCLQVRVQMVITRESTWSTRECSAPSYSLVIQPRPFYTWLNKG
jgi:hypothetical protein